MNDVQQHREPDLLRQLTGDPNVLLLEGIDLNDPLTIKFAHLVGADVNATFRSMHCLHLAISQKKRFAAWALMKAGSDPFRLCLGKTALSRAVDTLDTKMIVKIIKGMTSVKKQDYADHHNPNVWYSYYLEHLEQAQENVNTLREAELKNPDGDGERLEKINRVINQLDDRKEDQETPYKIKMFFYTLLKKKNK